MNIKFACCCGKQQSGRIVVVAAGTGGSKAIPYDKKKKAGKKHEEGRRKQQKRSTTDKKQQQNIMNTSMAKVKADETVLFDSVPGVSDALSVIYAYPNEYSVGITSLGYQLVWAYLEMSELVSVSRMFTDVSDGVAFKQRGVDLVGFSLSWELDYTNLVTMLQGLEIPVFSNERGKQCPIVFGGGPVLTANPEPFAAFFDVILLGDGEEMLETLVTTVYKVTRDGTGGSHDNRQEVLEALARLPGMYVPQFYEPVYDGGKLVGMDVLHAAAPPFVEKQTYRGNALASSTVVSPRMAWDNIFMAEVVRSCPEMCRFCMASYLTLPFRPAELEGSLIPTIERGLEVTDRIGLLGASVTQHPEFDKLLDWMMKPEREHVRMSIASVRTNTVTPELASALSARGTNSLTIAVESGSERVRRIVNKKLDQEDIQKAAVNAQAGGLKSLKLYGMVGVPGESDQDVEKTIEMMLALQQVAPKLKLTLGCSTFVPKAHTPFQWEGINREADKRLKTLEKGLRRHGIQFRPESYKWSVVQGLISRGDRRLTKLLMAAKDLGGSLSTFKRAAKEIPDLPPLEYYSHENYDPETSFLPWSHLHGPLPPQTLMKHYKESKEIIENEMH